MKGILLILILNFIVIKGLHSQSFDSLPPGISPSPSTLFFDNLDSILYAGGTFQSLSDGTPVKAIAQWNGFNWDSLGSGTDHVRSIVKYNGQIFVGGNFISVGGVPSKGVASWDGISWNYFADFTTPANTPFVRTLYVNGNDLYIGGGYAFCNGNIANGIVRYDGINFYTYPPITTPASISAIEIYNGELFVAGEFSGGVGNDIVKFNGTNWESVGGGFTGAGTIDDMIVFQNELYVCGHFLTSYGDPGNLIAKWNGTSWSSLGSGLLGGNCFSMEIFNNELYCAGSIYSAGGIPIDFIAKWDGSNWSSLNTSITGGIVQGLSANGSNLYLCGGFQEINNQSMVAVARYNLSTGFGNVEESNLFSIYPNPASIKTTIHLKGIAGKKIIVITDLYGNLQYESNLSVDTEKIILNLQQLTSGVYNLTILTDQQKISKKLIILK